MNAPAVKLDMPAEEYHHVEAMSYSGIKKMLRSPAHYRLARDEPSEPTESMEFGTAVHCGVLEPDRFSSLVCVAPKDINKRTKDGRSQWLQFQSENAQRIILSDDDYLRAEWCIEAINSHPAAVRLLKNAAVEVSLSWVDGEFKVPCKARLDAWNHGGIIDIKTTTDASPDAFARSAASFGYHIQGAFYLLGAEHCLNTTPEFFVMVAVESQPPYGVAVYSLPPVAVHAGMHLANKALALYRDALKAGTWQGYGDTIQTLQFPRWSLNVNP